MRQYWIIGNGEVKDSLTLKKRLVTNHVHSTYDDEKTALRMAHELNKLSKNFRFHVKEKVIVFPA